MVSRHESLKKYIKTVVDQLPPYVKIYPSDQKAILKDFLSILQKYEEADRDRVKLSNRFTKFRRKYYQTEKYFQLPFLWFCIDFFAYANIILHFADFNGTIFYEYLIKPLRRNLEGSVFEYLRRRVYLKDPSWEKLQYLCLDVDIPFKQHQSHIMDFSYSLIQEKGISSLNQHLITKSIAQKIDPSIKRKKLIHFYLLLDARWTIWFYPPSMGLKYLYVDFQLTGTSTLQEIINLNDLTNTTLLNSRLYKARGLPKRFFGYLTCPISDFNLLKSYISFCEERNLLNLKEMVEISDLYRSASLNLYQKENNWQKSLSADYKRMLLPLKNEKPRKTSLELPKYYLTNSFNKNWDFKQYPKPSQVINVFCKTVKEFNFSNLPYSPVNRIHSSEFSKSELSLLRYLYSKQISQVNLFFYTLLQLFSSDTYLISFPSLIPLEQLKRLLFLLPFSQIFYTDTNVKVLTILTPKIVQWLETNFGWNIQQVNLAHPIQFPNYSWFNTNTLEWKTPSCLEGFTR